MTDDRHVRADEYAEARSRPEARSSLALRLHRHLADLCPECGAEWELLADDQEALRQRMRESAARGSDSPEVPGRLLSCYSEEVRREEEDLRRIRTVRQKARVQTWHLQQAPPDRREEKIDGATAQFRSRAVAEFLLQRCRETIRDDPAEARSLASLVPVVLYWTPRTGGLRWVRDLEALSRAWHANAVRVCGDLPAADRAFAQLRLDLVDQPIESPAVLGEIRSLEASLRLAQRRHEEAAELLHQAALLFRAAADREGEVRVVINHANLLLDLGRSTECLDAFERAAESLSAGDSDEHLLCSTVNGRVVALCDLERYGEAEELLHQHMDLFESHLNSGALVRGLHGRIALGRGDHAAAAEFFRDSCDAFLAADRPYEAALACLDLAETHLQAGNLRELRNLARDVLPLFKARRVGRESLAALRLLSKAIFAEEVSGRLIARLRQELSGRRSDPT